MVAEQQERPKAIIAFRARDEVLTELERRSRDTLSVGQVAQRDLALYYRLLREELPVFTLAEATILAAATEQLEPTTKDAYYLLMVLLDYRTKQNANLSREQLTALAGVISKMSYKDTTDFRYLAVLDALAIYRTGPEGATPEERFRAAGLIE